MLTAATDVAPAGVRRAPAGPGARGPALGRRRVPRAAPPGGRRGREPPRCSCWRPTATPFPTRRLRRSRTLAGYPAVTSVPLGPLSQVEVGDYLRAIDATRPDASAGGAPRNRWASAALPRRRRTWTGRPPAICGMVVAGMLARLHRRARGGGDDVHPRRADRPDRPADVAEVDASTVAAGLRAGRRAGLLGPSTDDGVSFAHALLQDAVGVGRPGDLGWPAPASGRGAGRAGGDRPAAGRRGRRALAAGRPGTGRGPGGGSASPSSLPTRPSARSPSTMPSVTFGTPPTRSVGRCGRRRDRPAAGPAGHRRVHRRPARASIARCDAAGAAAERAGRPDLVAAAALVVRGVTSAGGRGRDRAALSVGVDR